MKSSLKAIETNYKGYRFRSRLEARWAVYFDAIGIEWEYEKEGFELGNGVRYLPDFWLPQVSMWAEVKPEDFSEEERDKIERLSLLSDCGVLMLTGHADLKSYWGVRVHEWNFDSPCIIEKGGNFVDCTTGESIPLIIDTNTETSIALYIAATEDGIIESLREDGMYKVIDGQEVTLDETDYILNTDYIHEKRFFACTGEENYKFNPSDNPKIARAVIAARSARFEFGENGGIHGKS